MNNKLALGAGIILIVAALWIAAGTTNQDNAPRPPVAQRMATAFHETPSPTPLPTETPIPTPTPILVRHLNPTAQEIVTFLFQYPHEGSYMYMSPAEVRIEPRADAAVPTLIVTGEGALLLSDGRLLPGALGAILVWENGAYQVKYRHVEYGYEDARVMTSLSANGQVTFAYHLVGYDAHPYQETFALDPCSLVKPSPLNAANSTCY